MTSGVFYKSRNGFIPLRNIIRVSNEVCLNDSRELLVSRDYFNNKVADLVFVNLKLNLMYLNGQLIIVTQLVIIIAGLFHILMLVFYVNIN